MKRFCFKENGKPYSIQTRSQLRKLTGKYMGDMLTRFPHIGEIIFYNLDDQSLLRCKKVSKSWYNFIDDKKFLWIRIIKKNVKESNEDYSQCREKS